MTAWERARTWQQKHSTFPFEERLGWHLSCGLVHCEPSCFVLASEVSWDASTRSSAPINSPKNAWFIELAATTTAPLYRIIQVLPHPHEWIIFGRNNAIDVHAYPWGRFVKRIGLPSL